MRPKAAIVDETNKIDFETDPKTATAELVVLMAELIGSLFAQESGPRSRDLWAIWIAIGELQKNVPYGRFYASEQTCERLLNELAATDHEREVDRPLPLTAANLRYALTIVFNWF